MRVIHIGSAKRKRYENEKSSDFSGARWFLHLTDPLWMTRVT